MASGHESDNAEENACVGHIPLKDNRGVCACYRAEYIGFSMKINIYKRSLLTFSKA